MSETWPPIKLGECCDILDNLRVPLNSEERGDIQGDIPYYGANGLQGYIDKFIFDEPLILLAEDGGYFDEYQSRPIAYRISGKSWVNNHAHILRAKSDSSFCQDYIFYSLQHKNITPFIKGGTRAKLNQAELREILISKAPEPIQRRIAEILATVDEAIEQTEALVQKWQQMKAGLMHDLFTRGVTPDGQLRPTRAQAPQLYKQSPLGWIPKEWEALKFAALLNSIDSGWSPECVEVPPPYGEWGVLKVSAITSGRFVASESKTLPPHLRPLPELEVKPGDVIAARANGVASLVGITVQVKDCPPSLMLSDKLLRLNPSPLATRDFLAGLMMSAATRSQLEGLMSGSSGQRNISQQQIRNLTTVCPSLDEQNLITDAQASLERNIEIESVHLAKLRAQKQGLMQDLLTGRVPVKIGTTN